MSFTLVPNEPRSFRQLNHKVLLEIFLSTILFLVPGFFISFDKYWFICGVCAAFIAVRHGFYHLIFINGIIFNYILPLINFGSLENGTHGSTQLLSVHLGMSTMFFGSALIGRVISDLRNSEQELTSHKKHIEEMNTQLSKANHEMDRFVYSVSHEISAPLKSIKGRIAISKLESKGNADFHYISKIEQSVSKLEDFTEEIF